MRNIPNMGKMPINKVIIGLLIAMAGCQFIVSIFAHSNFEMVSKVLTHYILFIPQRYQSMAVFNANIVPALTSAFLYPLLDLSWFNAIFGGFFLFIFGVLLGQMLNGKQLIILMFSASLIGAIVFALFDRAGGFLYGAAPVRAAFFGALTFSAFLPQWNPPSFFSQQQFSRTFALIWFAMVIAPPLLSRSMDVSWTAQVAGFLWGAIFMKISQPHKARGNII